MQNAKCEIPCHCEGACARGNLQGTFLHRTEIEESLRLEIATPVCALVRDDTALGLYFHFALCILHFAFSFVMSDVGEGLDPPLFPILPLFVWQDSGGSLTLPYRRQIFGRGEPLPYGGEM